MALRSFSVVNVTSERCWEYDNSNGNMHRREEGDIVTIAPVVPRVALRDDLCVADTSLWVQTLLVIIGVFSLWVARVLRDQLAGDPCAKSIPIRSILRTKTLLSLVSFVGCLYFLWDAQRVFQEADGLANCLSAKAELIGALLVLIATVLKLYSLSILSCKEVSVSEEIEIAELPII